jgi:HEAT repeat protein
MYFARLRCFLALALLSLSALAAPGCRTGPLAELYGYNPFYRMSDDESQYGPPPAERREQIQQLAADFRRSSPEERAAQAAPLAAQMQNEVDPLLRAEIVRTLGELNAAPSAEALRLAVKDSDASVRIAACKAWQRIGGAEAVSVLSEAIASDTDDDVRLAATRCLGEFQDPLAVQGLAVALDDSNPALQHRAMESLKESSGRDLGHDVVAWRQYIETGSPAERRQGPTLAERVFGRRE